MPHSLASSRQAGGCLQAQGFLRAYGLGSQPFNVLAHRMQPFVVVSFGPTSYPFLLFSQLVNCPVSRTTLSQTPAGARAHPDCLAPHCGANNSTLNLELVLKHQTMRREPYELSVQDRLLGERGQPSSRPQFRRHVISQAAISETALLLPLV